MYKYAFYPPFFYWLKLKVALFQQKIHKNYKIHVFIYNMDF